MYAPEFDYYRAGSVSEAAGLLRKYPGSKLLAGGQSLIPLLKLRLAAPVAVIDIGRIRDLKGITVKGGTIRVGAMTTHAAHGLRPNLPNNATRWHRRRPESATPLCATAVRSEVISLTPIPPPICRPFWWHSRRS